MEENGNLVRFIFNQNQEAVSEEDTSGLNRLIRASELIAANSSADSARTYYHYASDEMGATTHIVDEAGAVQNRYEYDAWGNITAQEEAVSNRFKFTGQQLDPVTQQYYLRARFYNPVVARFTQEDTYHGDGLNLYSYCDNNPICYVDYSGHEKTSAWGTNDKGENAYSNGNAQTSKQDIVGNRYNDSDQFSANSSTNVSHNPATPTASAPTTGQATPAQPVATQNRPGQRQNGQYHAFDVYHLDPSKRFSSDKVQFRAANKALQQRLQSDPAFRRDMFGRYPGLAQWSQTGDMGASLKRVGLVWHHDPMSYVRNGTFDLQLCDWDDHNANPNIYNDINGRGGRARWGGGEPGRNGHLDQNGNLLPGY